VTTPHSSGRVPTPRSTGRCLARQKRGAERLARQAAKRNGAAQRAAGGVHTAQRAEFHSAAGGVHTASTRTHGQRTHSGPRPRHRVPGHSASRAARLQSASPGHSGSRATPQATQMPARRKLISRVKGLSRELGAQEMPDNQTKFEAHQRVSNGTDGPVRAAPCSGIAVSRSSQS